MRWIRWSYFKGSHSSSSVSRKNFSPVCVSLFPPRDTVASIGAARSLLQET